MIKFIPLILHNEGRAVVWIDGGLHATEVAGPQHTPQLAYDILSRADEPDTKMALDNVVLMLWPTINPDGQTMVTEWYRGNVGTPYEVAPLPKLYQKYVGHDNNRDGYMINMIESRVMEHAWRAWEPQIIHVHHQTAPFPTRIWLPPFAEPIASRVPYLLSREVNMIGMAMAKGLEERGQVGATHKEWTESRKDVARPFGLIVPPDMPSTLDICLIRRNVTGAHF